VADAAAGCRALVKIYRTPTGEVHALRGIDATFPPAALSAVVGPSGSGKSTLLSILAGIEPPTAGSVWVGGTEIWRIRDGARRRFRRRRIGYVFQRPSDNLVPHLTVAEHLEQAARLRGVRASGEGEALLGAVGLAHRSRHLPHQLSGGEQQRLAFAQAILGAPALVVADEPTAELDTDSSQALLACVGSLRQAGTAVVVATHDPLVVDIADRTYHLRHGTLGAEAQDRAEGALAVIDEAGRIQLPPEALALFPHRRARVRISREGVWIRRP
jgi:putative ABC transport system ATP-binding protein